MRFGRSVPSALIVIPLSWRTDHYLIFLLFLLFSFAFNDLVDRKMDKDGHPERPLPSGRLNATEATLISAGLLAAGLGFTYWWAYDLFNIFAYTCGLSALYSCMLKRHVPLIATPIWALDVAAITCMPGGRGLLTSVPFFLFLYAHEVLLDMRDEPADRVHCSTPSIATVLGKNCWVYLVVLLTLYGMAQTAHDIAYVVEARSNGVYPIRVMLFELLSYAFFIYACYEVCKNLERAIEQPLETTITFVKRMLPLGAFL